MDSYEYSEETIDDAVIVNQSNVPVGRTAGRLEYTMRATTWDGGYVEITWTDHEVRVELCKDGVTEVREGLLRLVHRSGSLEPLTNQPNRTPGKG